MSVHMVVASMAPTHSPFHIPTFGAYVYRRKELTLRVYSMEDTAVQTSPWARVKYDVIIA